MYCAYDNDKNHVVAIHDEKKVIKKYCESICKFYDSHLMIGKIKKKKLMETKDFSSLYLVRVDDMYIQSGFAVYLEMCSCDEYKKDHRYCLDILLRILEVEKLSKKDFIDISKAVKIIERIIEDENEFVPDIYLLQKLKDDYSKYIDKRRYIDE